MLAPHVSPQLYTSVVEHSVKGANYSPDAYLIQA